VVEVQSMAEASTWCVVWRLEGSFGLVTGDDPKLQIRFRGASSHPILAFRQVGLVEG
jgi:hypothetical protein